MAPNLTRMFRNVLRSAGSAQTKKTVTKKTVTKKTVAKQTPPSPAPAPPSAGAPAKDSSLVGVTVEYNPDLDGDADPGEVVWTWVPWAEDPNQGKDRPVVIVGRRGSMLVGVPLTSKHHDNERQIDVGTGPWDREGRTSYAKLDRILDLDPAQIRREGSILGRAHFDQVVAALRGG